MELSRVGRALTTAVIFVLAGCGGAGTTAPVGATMQSRAHQASGSWMLPEAKGEDLIYVSSLDYYPPSSTSSVYVFSYPGASLVGTLTGFQYVGGLCTDSSGNVWITDGTGEVSNGVIYEYAHGATTPKATLEDADRPMDCSWDPSSGNLAVSGEARFGNVAVYPNGSGEPTYYSTEGFVGPWIYYITYDGSGNLYFANPKRKPAWLPEGGSNVMHFYISPRWNHGGLQWDGKYFTVLMDTTIQQYLPKGGHSGKPVGSVKLQSLPSNCYCYDSIEGSLVAVSTGGSVYVYKYPQGGNPTLTIPGVKNPQGVAISVPPPGKRIRE